MKLPAASSRLIHVDTTAALDGVTLTVGVTVTNLSLEREIVIPSATCAVTGPGLGEIQIPLGDKPGGYWSATAVATGSSLSAGAAAHVGEGTAAVAVTVTVTTHSWRGTETVVTRTFASRPQAGEPALTWQERGPWLVAPVATHIWTPGEKLTDIVATYVAPHFRQDDILIVAESPLAILQGRLRHPDDIVIRPGTRCLARQFNGNGSLGTAAGLQALIDQVGYRKLLAGVTSGVLGKVRGRRGDFYRTVGRASALIDDVSGTLAPYDRYVVLGPENPDNEAATVWSALGIPTVVADANDLGNVDLIGMAGVRTSLLSGLAAALASNPAGNGYEQTPLVLARPAD